jgi:deoxyadenosine/deoxycytidine kinase
MNLFLAPKPTLPTDFGSIEEVTDTSSNDTYLQKFYNELKRYGIYIREKFMEIFERMKKKFKQIRSRISDHFNF